MGAIATAAAFVGLSTGAEAYIYVGDTTRIVRANNDGTGVDRDFITVNGFLCGLAVTSTHIYWSDLDGIGRANLDGTNVQDNWVPSALPILSANACGVSVDSQSVYWTENNASAVYAASLASPSAVPIATLPYFGCGTAVDAANIYATSRAGNGPPVQASKTVPGPATPIPSAASAGDLAACAIATGPNGVYYANREHAGAETPIKLARSVGPVETIVSGVNHPCGLAVHGSSVLWVSNQQDKVGTVALTAEGSAAAPPNQNLITGFSEPCGIAVDSLPLPPPPPPGGGGGDATFTLGKATLDRKKGTATLAITATGAGTFALTGKLVKSSSASLEAAGGVELAIKAKGKAKKALKKKGKAKVSYTIAFTPASGAPSSKDGALKLKRKR
jgi:hypothetical protein